jgi:hypothetical protein
MAHFRGLPPSVIPARAGIQFRAAYPVLRAKFGSRFGGNDEVVCGRFSAPARPRQ